MDRLKSRMERTEDIISELEHSKIEITQSEQQRENRLKENEPQGPVVLLQKVEKLYHQSPRKEEKKGRTEKVFKEVMTEKFQNLAKDVNLQIQEAV